AQRSGACQDPYAAAVCVYDGRDSVPAVVQEPECALWIGTGWQREEFLRHHMPELRESVDARAVGLGDHADRLAVVVEDDDGAMRPLRQQAQGVSCGRLRTECQRRVVDEIALLDPGNDLGHDIDRDVLRQHGDATAPGDSLGHSAARYG